MSRGVFFPMHIPGIIFKCNKVFMSDHYSTTSFGQDINLGCKGIGKYPNLFA